MANDSLPRAVATGGAASVSATAPLPEDAVRPRRVGVIVGALAAAWLLVVFAVQPIPDTVRGWFGAHDAFGRRGGLHLVWMPPPGFDRSQLEHGDHDAVRVDARGSDVVLDLAGVAEPDIAGVAARLVTGPVEMHVVRESDELARAGQLAGVPTRAAPETDDAATVEPVTIDVDEWHAETDGARHAFGYLRGSRDAVVRALDAARRQGWTPPQGTHVVFEPVPDRRRRDAVRTYLVDDAPEVTGDDIDYAEVITDPVTDRPTVMVQFTRAGTSRFADATRRLVGHKLATIQGDAVISAPVIDDPITGGRASIAMGAGKLDDVARRATELAESLRGPGALRGGHVVSATYIGPEDGPLARWLARALIAAVGGALAGLLAFALVRAVRPRRAAPVPRAPGRLPWQRLAITLLAPATLFVLAWIPLIGLPTLDVDPFLSLMSRGGLAVDPSDALTFGALGVMPWIYAFLLVELVATIVPPWRRRRHAGPAARRPLVHVTIALAVAIAVVQARLIVSSLDSNALEPIPLSHAIAMIASLCAGTLALGAVAWLVRMYGIGNGWIVLVGAGALTRAVDLVLGLTRDLPDAGELALAAATCAAIAVLVAGALRWRVGGRGELALRVPASGEAPITDASAILGMLGLLGAMGAVGAAATISRALAAIGGSTVALLALVIAMTLLWSFAFARPRVLAAAAIAAGVSPPQWSTWWRATAISVAFLLALALLELGAGGRGLAGGAMVALLVALVLDMAADVRGRRRAQRCAWSLHSAQHADLAARALADAGIAHHLSATRVRTLLAWFGPFVPIDVWVAPADAAAAQARLSELFALA